MLNRGTEVVQGTQNGKMAHHAYRQQLIRGLDARASLYIAGVKQSHAFVRGFFSLSSDLIGDEKLYVASTFYNKQTKIALAKLFCTMPTCLFLKHITEQLFQEGMEDWPSLGGQLGAYTHDGEPILINNEIFRKYFNTHDTHDRFISTS